MINAKKQKQEQKYTRNSRHWRTMVSKHRTNYNKQSRSSSVELFTVRNLNCLIIKAREWDTCIARSN